MAFTEDVALIAMSLTEVDLIKVFCHEQKKKSKNISPKYEPHLPYSFIYSIFIFATDSPIPISYACHFYFWELILDCVLEVVD